MRGAGFDARLSRTIARDMWEKWLFLATVGGINCLMRGNVGEVQAAMGGAAFMVRLLDEVTAPRLRLSLPQRMLILRSFW